MIAKLPAASDGGASTQGARRWGIILAGGDGTRLKNLTRLVCGDDRPKQFCPLVGKDTLVEQTRKRAERCISSEQILFLLTRSHSAFYLNERGLRPSMSAGSARRNELYSQQTMARHRRSCTVF